MPASWVLAKGGKKGTQKRVKCPWFVLQVSEKKSHTVFITVWK